MSRSFDPSTITDADGEDLLRPLDEDEEVEPMRAEVWILVSERTVLCQIAGVGVPTAAVIASDGTMGGTIFDRASLLGPFDLPENGGWGKAGAVAREEAAKRDYRVEFFDPWCP